MSLQTRRGFVVRGNPEKNIPTGTRFRFVKRAADAKLGKSVLAKHRRASRSPSERFSPSSPGQVVDGTEDSAKAVTRPPASGADCLFRQVRGGYCRGHYTAVIPVTVQWFECFCLAMYQF